MINPAFFRISQPKGPGRTIIIEPVLEKSGEGGIKGTGVYKLYKSAVDNESSLFTEALEIDERNDDLPDKDNPDFLGDISIMTGGKWRYEGDLLSHEEQQQVAEYISNNN